jgi:hypothetical protein
VIWHPVAESSSDKVRSVAVRFDDGTVDVTLNIGEEVEVAIVQDLQDGDATEGWALWKAF